MKVLLAGQLGAGGAERQIECTARELQRLGVTTELTAAQSPDCRGYDLMHVFNAPDPQLTRQRIAGARACRRPVVLSTIYWNAYELYMQWAQRGWRSADEQRFYWRQRKQALKPVYAGADMWLPNSYAEYGMLAADFEVNKPYRVVPNAVETGLAALPETDVPQSDVLMVGRWELRKNQLGLLEALADTEHKILIIGEFNNEDSEHNEAATKLVQHRRRVQILSATTNRPFIASVMKNARVLAQPSFYETPGLAALEAAACGTAVVVSDRGCTREYFGDEAYYCDPTDPSSIRQAIEAALAGGPSPTLRKRITTEFTWMRAAEETKIAYRELLDGL